MRNCFETYLRILLINIANIQKLLKYPSCKDYIRIENSTQSDSVFMHYYHKITLGFFNYIV